jgi:hypothetical protein
MTKMRPSAGAVQMVAFAFAAICSHLSLLWTAARSFRWQVNERGHEINQ